MNFYNKVKEREETKLAKKSNNKFENKTEVNDHTDSLSSRSSN
jgi:hypothetical protein